MDNLILVTGATGYIASRLIPRLLEYGYQVRCLARDPRRLSGRNWSDNVELVQGDVLIPSTLICALDGVHTAYYLIHNMTYGGGYIERELDGAQAFASAAGEAGVQHIIYLGGLANPEQLIDPHIGSRIETGRILREGKVPVTEFRAGVIIGSGSISFEMIRFITELFPLVPGPSWMKNQSQPIAIQNVIDYLFAALESPHGRGGIYEIGGPDITTYGDLMMRYARIRGLRRGLILFPRIPLWFMALGVGLMTPVPSRIAYALFNGSAKDSIVRHDEVLRIFPEVKLIDFDFATRDALQKTHPSYIERIWDVGEKKASSIKHEGCFIDFCDIHIRASPDKVFEIIMHVVDNQNWYVDVIKQNRQIIIRKKKQPAGDQWIEWFLDWTTKPPGTKLTQTIFFSPLGLPGFLYWYLFHTFHRPILRALLRKIAQQSEN